MFLEFLGRTSLNLNECNMHSEILEYPETGVLAAPLPQPENFPTLKAQPGIQVFLKIISIAKMKAVLLK